MWLTDGVVDVVSSTVGFEPNGSLVHEDSWHIGFLVQGESVSSEGVWGFLGVVRVSCVLNEWVLIWVPVLQTGAATPRSPCCWHACQCRASLATFVVFLLCTACTNCSSLHCTLIFIGLCSCDSFHVGRDSQYSFSFPKLIVAFLGLKLVGRSGSQPIRV